ncbi:hypothetical protein [Henriciella aquimarina]|uniref:hypothetical protein n=1 Tax=Henriciella aquimarina TaxID=545261 RepID=UPI00117BDBC3|nr:hypothetical protein [Henriciella aquimarina]
MELIEVELQDYRIRDLGDCVAIAATVILDFGREAIEVKCASDLDRGTSVAEMKEVLIERALALLADAGDLQHKAVLAKALSTDRG